MLQHPSDNNTESYKQVKTRKGKEQVIRDIEENRKHSKTIFSKNFQEQSRIPNKNMKRPSKGQGTAYW